jgi:CcmD family protein
MTYLFAAYSIIWILIFLYLFSLKSRQRNLEKLTDSLQKQIDNS